MEEQTELMKSFPLMLPSEDLKIYDGIMQCVGLDFRITLKIPYYPSLTDMSVEFSSNVGYLLQNQRQKLEEESLVKDKLPERKEYISAECFQKIFDELDEIGVKHVVSLSSNLGHVKLKVVDEADREHFLDVDCSNNYPHQLPYVSVDLPEHSVKIIKENTSLVNIFNSFVKEVNNLQELWRILDALDSSCWVLDPENPTKKDTVRRILISKTVSIFVQINLENVNSIPSITFLGPEQAVEPIQQHLMEHQELWSKENTVVDNLRLVLGLESLMKRTGDKEGDSLVREGECCICYATHLEGQLPSEICEDERCSSSFHSSCLFQWLQTVAGNYVSFNRIHGECPNCGTIISCPVPT